MLLVAVLSLAVRPVVEIGEIALRSRGDRVDVKLQLF